MFSSHKSIIKTRGAVRLDRPQHFTTCGAERSEVSTARDSMHILVVAAALLHLAELVVSCGHRVDRRSGQQASVVLRFSESVESMAT